MIYKGMFIAVITFSASLAAAELVDLTAEQKEAFNQIEALNLKCKQSNESTAGAFVRALVWGNGMSSARMKSCLTRDELIEKMKREGVCEEPPYESAFDRRCIVKQKNKSLDPEILAAIAERERQNRPPALDKASYKKWFKRAETIRQMGMTCTAYIDDELPTVIGTALGKRGCNETLNRDEINGVRQTVSRELQSEYDKTKNGKWDEKWDNSPWVSVFDICPSHSFL